MKENVLNNIVLRNFHDEKELLKFCEALAELSRLLTVCCSCYYNYYKSIETNSEDSWFLIICPMRPHRLVWAKQKSYPIYPAKVLAYDDSLGFYIQFFGSNHIIAYIQSSSCFLLTDNLTLEKYKNLFKDSAKIIKKSKSERNKLIDALQEADQYAQKLGQLFTKEKIFSETLTECHPNDIHMCITETLEVFRKNLCNSSSIESKCFSLVSSHV